jgi:hypothetical protein
MANVVAVKLFFDAKKYSRNPIMRRIAAVFKKQRYSLTGQAL